MSSLDLYNAKTFVEAAGITYRQFDYWTTNGFLQPVRVHGAESGTGHRRVLSGDELKVAKVMARLVEDGLTPPAAGRVARDLLAKGEGTLGGLLIRFAKSEPAAVGEAR